MTGTLFQTREYDERPWPKRELVDAPRCVRCGTDLRGEAVSVLSRHCRACLDTILKASRDE
jgi:hypothetical protein